jgi:hypothetical protein
MLERCLVSTTAPRSGGQATQRDIDTAAYGARGRVGTATRLREWARGAPGP